MVQICKTTTSSVVFLILSTFLFSGSIGVKKRATSCPKWLKMSHLVCQKPYVRSLGFLVQILKWWCLKEVFSFFKILIFEVFSVCVCVCVCVCVSVCLCVCGTGVGEGLKRGKNNLKLHFSVCFAPYLRSFRPYHQDFNNEIYRCFSLYFFRKYNVVNIKIVLFFIGPLQQFF